MSTTWQVRGGRQRPTPSVANIKSTWVEGMTKLCGLYDNFVTSFHRQLSWGGENPSGSSIYKSTGKIHLQKVTQTFQRLGETGIRGISKQDVVEPVGQITRDMRGCIFEEVKYGRTPLCYYCFLENFLWARGIEERQRGDFGPQCRRLVTSVAWPFVDHRALPTSVGFHSSSRYPGNRWTEGSKGVRGIGLDESPPATSLDGSHSLITPNPGETSSRSFYYVTANLKCDPHSRMWFCSNPTDFHARPFCDNSS